MGQGDGIHQAVLALFLAFGVVVGGSLLGGLAAIFTGRSPIATIQELARTIKLWAVVVAVGGSFPTLQAIESGLLARQPAVLGRQMLAMAAGMAGAQAGQWLVLNLTGP